MNRWIEMQKKRCRNNTKESYIAVFRAHIDLTLEDAQFVYSPIRRPDNKAVPYQDITYEKVVQKSREIINNDLKKEFQRYTDVPIINVEAKAVYDGSIEIIFTVVLDFLALIGGIKDLYDVTNIIQIISERHIRKGLQDEFKTSFDVDVRRIVPGSEYMREYRHNEQPLLKNDRMNGRDGFFYYLLVANIILFVLIAVLVFGAVKIVYFG